MAEAPLLSIGHSSHSPEKFIQLLRSHFVTTLVDIRSQPYSQFSPQFNHSHLKRLLEVEAIAYEFAGDSLGGRPSGREFYDKDGHVLYYKVAESEVFQLGISRLHVLADQTEHLAIMCAEEDPTNCHRRLLVARVLQESGCEILHIRASGRLQKEIELGPADKVSSLVQPSLFYGSQESSWKSTRSVLPERQRNNSSSH